MTDKQKQDQPEKKNQAPRKGTQAPYKGNPDFEDKTSAHAQGLDERAPTRKK